MRWKSKSTMTPLSCRPYEVCHLMHYQYLNSERSVVSIGKEWVTPDFIGGKEALRIHRGPWSYILFPTHSWGSWQWNYCKIQKKKNSEKKDTIKRVTRKKIYSEFFTFIHSPWTYCLYLSGNMFVFLSCRFLNFINSIYFRFHWCVVFLKQ